MSSAETLVEGAKGHGALAVRTEGWVSLQNTALEYSLYHRKKGHSAVRFQYTLTNPKPSAREADPIQTSSSLTI